nr:hypothetical protein [Streptomyces sp. NBC_01808]
MRLDALGEYVEFTLTARANAVNVAYSVPDGKSGSLAVYAHGTKLDASLAVTSGYSPSTPPGSPGRHVVPQRA